MPLGCYYYPSAYGRLGALKSQGLNTDFLQELLEKNNLGECITKLKQKPIPFWDRIDEENLLISEHYLRMGNILQANKIFNFMNGKAKYIFKLIIYKIDLYNLKLAARNILSSNISEIDLNKRLYIHPTSCINKRNILKAKKINEIGSAIKDDFLRNIFEKAYNEYDNKKDFFYFELGLDYYYHSRLWEYLNNLGLMEFQNIKKSFLYLQEAFRDFLWMVKLRYLSKLEQSEIYHYVCLNSNYFNKDDFWFLSDSEKFEDLLNKIKKTGIGKFIGDKLDNIKDINGLEILLNRILWTELNKISSSNYPFRFIIFLNFLYKQEFLVEDIIKILQGKKYNLSNKNIINYLITIGG